MTNWSSSSPLAAYYASRPVILWVEDALTKLYFEQIWQDSDIGILVAGNNDSVHAVVNDARASGALNVFGFRDRDFIESNADRWSRRESQISVFVPRAYEIENYFLDFNGLSAVSGSFSKKKLEPAEIERLARELAQQGLWWMATRATIAEIRKSLTDGFPQHPKWSQRQTTVRDLLAAQTYLETEIISSTWGMTLRAFDVKFDRTWIAERLRHYGMFLESSLHQGTWRDLWSGKELLEQLSGQVASGRKKPMPDIVKVLGVWQRTNKAVPPEIDELRNALRSRVR